MNLAISFIDSAIIFLFILATVWLGVWIGKGSNQLSSYFVGERSLPWWAVLGSIIATETSAVTFLSIPGTLLAPGGNFNFLQLALGFVIGRAIVVAWLLPAYFTGQIFTAYDVLHKRFGGLTQRAASMLFMLTRTVGDGLRLYLTALVLYRVSGLDIAVCILIMGVTTIVYSSLGGIKSIVWNDCIQLVIYLCGAVAAILVILSALPNGLADVLEVGRRELRFHWVDWSFDLQSKNIWSGVIGGLFITLASHGTDQLMVQRYLCAKSQRQASWALLTSGPLIFLQFALFLFVGVALRAFYLSLDQTTFTSNDEVFAAFIVDHLPIGICGLTLAAVFSVAMSTLSSSLSSSSSAVVNDFLLPQMRRAGLSGTIGDGGSPAETVDMDAKATRAGKIWTVVFGCLQMLVGIIVAYTPALADKSIVDQVITIAGFTSGLILGVFLLGQTRRNFAQRSLMTGMVIGFVVTALLVFDPFHSGVRVHGWWAAVVASSTTILISCLVDLGWLRKDNRQSPTI